MKAYLLLFFIFLAMSSQAKLKGWKEIKPIVDNFTIAFPATATIEPKIKVDIKPAVSGRIDRVKIEEGQYVRKGDVMALMSSTDRAALIDAAKAEGQSAVRRWEKVYKPIPIMAPITGTVIKLNIVPGQTVTATTNILTLADDLIVKAEVDETDMAKVKLGQIVKIQPDAFPNKNFEAKVERIAYQATLKNNVNIYEVIITTQKLPQELRAGMGASAHFQVDKKSKAILLPTWIAQGRESVNLDIFVKSDKGKPVKKTISIGKSNGVYVEVIKNLSDKEVVLYQPLKIKKKKKNALNL